MNKNKLTTLLFSMFRIGLIGFGGGNALIPIIESVAVEEQHMVTQDAYEEDVVVASITPGALPVEIAGGIGRRTVGSIGLLFGSTAMALPGTILTILMLSVISVLSDAVLTQIRYISVGVGAFICCLLTEYIAGTISRSKEHGEKRQILTVILLVFVLTCGKNLYRILGVSAKPLFSITTVYIFAATFFLLLYLGENGTAKRRVIGLIVAGVYIFSKGRISAGVREKFPILEFAVITAMIILSFYGLMSSKERNYSLERSQLIRTGKEILWILVITLIFLIFSSLITGDTLLYAWNGFLSSVMSFGGGDAYLTVADGLFVHTELIQEDYFYNYLVPIVNILPGSILCKTLSGIGYFIGYTAHGRVMEGIIVAFTGFFVSLLASCGVFDIIGCFYAGFRELYFIKGIKKWIRPVVSGLMLTVILSLLYQSVKLGLDTGETIAPILMVLIFLLDLLMVHRLKFKNGNIVFLSAVLSFITLNIA